MTSWQVGHQRIYIGLLAHIGSKAVRLETRSAQFVLHFLYGIKQRGSQHHLRPGRGQGAGELLAEPPAGTSDKRQFCR